MKQLLLFVCLISIVSCKKEPKNYTLLSGKIENTTSNTLILKSNDFEKEITLNSDGTFKDTLRLTKTNFYKLSIDKNNIDLFLNKDDDLELLANSKNLKNNLKFEGELAEENAYLFSKIKTEIRTRDAAEKLFGLDENNFKAKLDNIETENFEALSSIKAINQLFFRVEKENLKYEKLSLYNGYERSHAFFSKNKTFKVSKNFIPEELKNNNFDNAELYNMSSAYQELALNNSINKIFNSVENTSSPKPEDFKLIENIKIPELKDDVISFASKMLMSPSNENLKDMHNFFKNNLQSKKVKAEIDAVFEKNIKLVKGSVSPKFVNYENNAGGKTSLDDLKGKYIYIDVWATWCGPCIGEIPALKKIEKQYHNQNIEFVSISIDRKNAYKTWKTMITEKNLGGIQLIADKSGNSQFIQDYAIEGIPRFILIDPQGHIINADAPRPSNPELINLLDTELKVKN